MFKKYRGPKKSALVGAAMLAAVPGVEANVNPHDAVDTKSPIIISEHETVEKHGEFDAKTEVNSVLQRLSGRLGENRDMVSYLGSYRLNDFGVIISIKITGVAGVTDREHSFRFDLGDGLTDTLTEELIMLGVMSKE